MSRKHESPTEHFLNGYLNAKERIIHLGTCMRDIEILANQTNNDTVKQLYHEYEIQIAQSVQDMEEVFNCIHQVKDKRSEYILLMRYILGYRIKEIADELKLSIGRVSELNQKALSEVQIPVQNK